VRKDSVNDQIRAVTHSTIQEVAQTYNTFVEQTIQNAQKQVNDVKQVLKSDCFFSCGLC